MSALVPARGLADSLAELFEPIDAAPIDALLAAHAEERQTIERIAGIFADPRTASALVHFREDQTHGRTAEHFFQKSAIDGAFRSLDAEYWRRALEATDVLACMPAKRRDEWNEQLHKCDVPPFTESAIRATLAEHIASRHRYFAERVDGLWRALSPDHRTNLATGFRSKMILQGITHEWYAATGRADHLTDLRIVVARFMGRAIEREWDVHDLTRKLVEQARRHSRGEWVEIDGGAIGIRLYGNGNCHVRVHEEMAWRLNAVLASVNPGAIPESNRTRPAYTGKRKAASPTPTLMTRPLPFAVLRALGDYNHRASDLGPREWHYGYGWMDLDKHVRAEVLAVLSSIGAVEIGDDYHGRVRFDYDATEVLREVVFSGCVPDQRAHQYYPTPTFLAERVVELAQIKFPDDLVLEPSAGQGHIAELLPRDQTMCVEASALHCAVLRSKGLTVEEGDFLAYRTRTMDPTVVVMNPPFDRGQWRAHVEHAARVLSPREGSRIVAILPESAARSLSLEGFEMTWSSPIEGAFSGTSISVVILLAIRGGN